MPDMNEAHDAWIKDGKVDTAPVTESTPVIDTASAGDASASATATDTSSAPAEVTPVVEMAVVATPAETQAAIEYLEARQGDKPYQIPKDILLPITRKGETKFVPLSEALASPMMENDYRIKTSELSTQRKTVEATEARLRAEEKIFQDEKTQFEAALKDPTQLENWRAHYEQMATNPVYRENVEKARAARVTEAELGVYKEAENNELLQTAATNLYNEIKGMASEYPGVDPERIRVRYAELCQAGRITEINRESIAAVYKEEAQYSTSLLSPLQKQIADLSAKVETLSASTAVATHNAKTDKAIAAAKGATVVAAVGAGAPPAPAGREAPKPFTLRELPEKTREWVNRR